jgi:hypothetical protein
MSGSLWTNMVRLQWALRHRHRATWTFSHTGNTLDRQIPQSPLVAAVARDGSRAAAWADRVRNGVRRHVPVRGRPGDRSDFKALDYNRQIVLFHQANMGITPVSTKFEAEPL